VCEASLRSLREGRKLRAIVYGNCLEHLAKAIAVFITENLHRRDNSAAGFALNADSQIVLRLFFNERDNN